MDTQNHEHHNTSDPMYWILFLLSFITSMETGVKHYIGNAVNAVALPAHHIWWLPELTEAIPTMILAILVAAASFITNQILKIGWRKMFTKKS